jgi:hypothetical protein
MIFTLIFTCLIPALFLISTIIFIILKIVKKKKIFFLGIFGSLGLGIVSFVIGILGQIIFFFVMGMLRPLLPAMANNILNVKSYTYKTIIENKPDYNHRDTQIEENICEFTYGFIKNPYNTKAIVNNELVAREGPPFAFMLDLDNLSHDIDSVYIKNAGLISNSGTKDLFARGTISVEF